MLLGNNYCTFLNLQVAKETSTHLMSIFQNITGKYVEYRQLESPIKSGKQSSHKNILWLEIESKNGENEKQEQNETD